MESALDPLRHLASAWLLPAPLRTALKVSLDEVDAGRAAGSTELANPRGTMHGRVTATFLDRAMGHVVHPTLLTSETSTTLAGRLVVAAKRSRTGR